MGVFTGTAGNDTRTGTSLRDYITGLGGNDTLSGLGGNDVIYGGEGHDDITGGDGGDLLYGEAGDDLLFMTSTATTEGADLADGGDGLDIAIYTAYLAAGDLDTTATTVIDMLDNSKNGGLAATDVLTSVEGFIGGAGKDIVSGTDDENLFLASLGDDIYNGRGGKDAYFAYQLPIGAGPGRSITFELAFGSQAQSLALTAGVQLQAGQGIAFYTVWNDTSGDGQKQAEEISHEADILSAIEYFVGTHGNDRLTGSGADETFAGLSGEDVIDGGGGLDMLSYEPQQEIYSQWGSHGGSVGPVEVDLASGVAKVGELFSNIVNIEGA